MTFFLNYEYIQKHGRYNWDWPFDTNQVDLSNIIALPDPVKPSRNHNDLPLMLPEVKPISNMI